MNDNPYSPPADAVDETDGILLRLLYASGFWLSVLVAAFLVIASLSITTTNLQYKFSTGNPLPTYIYALFFFVPACAAGFAYSAIQWRKQLARRGMLAFALSTVATLFGPRVLLAVLL